MIRSEIFATQEQARAAFLAGDEPPTSEVPGARPSAEHGLARIFNERDWDAAPEVLHEDYRWEDRRPGRRAVLEGRDAFVGMLRRVARERRDLARDGVGALRRRAHQPGRVVQRGSYRGGPYEFAFLALTVLGPDGRAIEGMIFEESEVDARVERDARLAEACTTPEWTSTRPMRASSSKPSTRGIAQRWPPL